MGSDSHLARLKEGAAAWNKWRQQEPLVRPDLQGLSLTLAQKQWGETNGGPINFAHAVLHDADLRHATLIRGNLEGASLSGADLSSARLGQANLSDAVISGVCFDNADLADAIFRGADLRGADLRGARNLNLSQIAAARGNAETLLPSHLDAPKSWTNGGLTRRPVAEPPVGVPVAKLEAKIEAAKAEAARAEAAKAEAAKVKAAKTDAAKVQAAKVSAKVSAKAAAEPPIASPPRLEPRLALIVGLAGLVILFSVESLLAPKNIDAATLNENPPIAAPAPQEAPQRMAVSETGAATAVRDIRAGTEASPAGVREVPVPVEAKELPIGAIERAPVRDPGSPVLALDDLAQKSAEHPIDETIRLAFVLGAKDIQDVPGVLRTSPERPDAASASRALIEPLADRPVEVRSLLDTMKRIDLPKPTEVAKATPVEEKQAPRTPASVVDYLSTPQSTSDWVEIFIRDFYLSESALDESQIRRIYSDPVDYFGQNKKDLAHVAREKARYYRLWPKRHYDLIPGSIAIQWKSANVADVTFMYHYKVSASNRKSQTGRGRAHVTLDLAGPAGLIVREDGELIGRN